MTTKIIQLREKDDQSKQDDGLGGNFQSVLKEPLYIEKGDQIRMKTAFLSDIQANQNTVVFKEDLTVTFYISRYIRDWGSYQIASNYNEREAGSEAGTHMQKFSNRDFVMCQSTNTVNSQSVNSLIVEVNKDALKKIKVESVYIHIGYFMESNTGTIPPGGNDPQESAHIIFQVSRKELQRRVVEGSGNFKGKSVIIIDNSLGIESGHLNFPRMCINDNINNGPKFTIYIPKGDFGRRTNRNDFFKSIVIGETTPANAGGVNAVFTPWRRPLAITIPKNLNGYSQEEFTNVINEQLAQIVTDKQNIYPVNGIDNPCLGTTTEATTKLGSIPYFISTDGKQYKQFPNASNNWVGTNHFAIIYRDDLSKYQIAQTHMPIYNSQQDGVLLLSRNNGGGDLENYVANKAGGIIIESTDPPDFLQTYFKFNADIFAPHNHTGGVTMTPPGGATPGDSSFVNTIVPTFDLIEGVNVTGHYVTLDSLVDKGGDNFESPLAHVRMDAAPAPLAATISEGFIAETEMHSIISETISTVQEGEAYYQIEISMPVNTDIRGQEDKNNKIQGIVGRYYSKDSYTSAVEYEGSIPYVHQSDDPLVLNSFKVRILDPAGEQMMGLQSDNTVFLEVIKSTKSI